VVARDGIEPPTPAFSGPPSNLLSGLESSQLADNKEKLKASCRVEWYPEVPFGGWNVSYMCPCLVG
jgi:hypothetical protein